jgi:hypothetical protein
MAQDYILRMIEQAARMLEVILAERLAGHDKEASQKIEHACVQEIGLPFSLVRLSSPETLSNLMQQSGNGYVRSVLLAELLIQESEINDATGDRAGKIRGQLQAFCLLGESIDVLSPEEQAVYRPKLDKLAGQLREAGSDSYLMNKLREFGY